MIAAAPTAAAPTAAAPAAVPAAAPMVFLGRGSCKAVYASRGPGGTGLCYAYARSSPQAAVEFRRELAILKLMKTRNLRHMHVLGLIGTRGSADGPCCMIFPRAPLGSVVDLSDALDFEGASLRFTAMHTFLLTSQVFASVLFLRRVGVDHGDVALRNLLVFGFGRSSLHLKLCDFGSARLLDPRERAASDEEHADVARIVAHAMNSDARRLFSQTRREEARAA